MLRITGPKGVDSDEAILWWLEKLKIFVQDHFLKMFIYLFILEGGGTEGERKISPSGLGIECGA